MRTSKVLPWSVQGLALHFQASVLPNAPQTIKEGNESCCASVMLCKGIHVHEGPTMKKTRKHRRSMVAVVAAVILGSDMKR